MQIFFKDPFIGLSNGIFFLFFKMIVFSFSTLIITSRVNGGGNIFGSARLSVCLLDLQTQNLAHTLRTIIPQSSSKDKVIDQRSRSSRSKMSNSCFQPMYQKRWSKIKVMRVKVVGQGHKGQGDRVKVKLDGESFLSYRLAGGATRGHFHFFTNLYILPPQYPE